MPVKRNSAAVDLHVLVTFDDLARTESSTARTTITDSSDGASKNVRVLGARLYPTTMVRYIAHQNDAAHVLPHSIVLTLDIGHTSISTC